MNLPDEDPLSPAARRQVEALRVQQVCAWIDLHLAEDIGWDRLVRISGMSVVRLQEAFRRHAKTTPMTYIRQRRAQADDFSPVPRKPDLPPSLE